MTITYDILRVGGDTSAVNVLKLTESGLTFIDTESTKGGRGKRSVYKIATGDAQHETTVVAQQTLSEDGLTRNVLVAVNTWAHKIDSVSGEETYRRISGTQTFSIPLDVGVEVDDLMYLAMNVWSLLYPSVSAGAPATTRLSQLALYGLTEVLK